MSVSQERCASKPCDTIVEVPWGGSAEIEVCNEWAGCVLEGIGGLLKGRDGIKVKRRKDGLGYNFSKGPSDSAVNCGARRTPVRTPVTPQ